MGQHPDGAERGQRLLRRPLAEQLGTAATSVLLAASPLLEGEGGRYFEDCKEAEPAAYALDPDAAERLWDLSELSLRG